MNTTNTLISLGRQPKSIFKPLMTACDTLQSLKNGQKAIVSINRKITIHLIKQSHNLIYGTLWKEKKLISSYTSDPEIVSGYLDNDLIKLNIGGN